MSVRRRRAGTPGTPMRSGITGERPRAPRRPAVTRMDRPEPPRGRQFQPGVIGGSGHEGQGQVSPAEQGEPLPECLAGPDDGRGSPGSRPRRGRPSPGTGRSPRRPRPRSWATPATRPDGQGGHDPRIGIRSADHFSGAGSRGRGCSAQAPPGEPRGPGPEGFSGGGEPVREESRRRSPEPHVTVDVPRSTRPAEDDTLSAGAFLLC